MLRALLAAAAIALAGCSRASTEALPLSRIQLVECDVDGVTSRTLCGTYEVWEDREAKAGRRIPLNIVVIPATGIEQRQRSGTAAAPLPAEPVFYLDGGPGGSAAGAARWVSRMLREVNASRDLVFVDVRGTGRSAPLECPLPADTDPLQTYFEEFLSDRYVRDCLGRQEADVRFYTQPIAMDDIHEVRGALGYGRINLFGTSGGTRQAQLYIRRHGETARAVVMQGVAPVDGELPLAFGHAMEIGIRALIDGCAADAACRAAHPSLDLAWEGAKRQFEQGPVRANVRHPRTGRQEQVMISRGVFADGIRHMLYNLQAARALPAIIEAAARREFEAFAQAELEQTIRFGNAIAHGFFLSSTCAEDVRFIDEDDVRRATIGTFLGDYRVRRQQSACRLWPRGVGVDDDYQQPVISDIPVLAISGDADVATPAGHAERVVRHLPNARHVVFPNQGHALRDPVCASRLIAEFIQAGSAKELDVSCAGTPSP